jgi:chromosome partitioning protein
VNRRRFLFSIVPSRAGEPPPYEGVHPDGAGSHAAERVPVNFKELKDLAENCDLLVLPAVPEAAANDGLIEIIGRLDKLQSERFRVLLAKVPPRPKTDGEKLRAELEKVGIPVFKAEIPLLTAFDRAYTGGVLVRDVKRDPYALFAWEAYEAAGREMIDGR